MEHIRFLVSGSIQHLCWAEPIAWVFGPEFRNAAAQASRKAGVAFATARGMTGFLDRAEAPCYVSLLVSLQRVKDFL